MEWPERTLFVERQKCIKPVKGNKMAVMTQKWRLLNTKELYDIAKDPAQKNNVAAEYPEVVKELNRQMDEYWNVVSPDDRSYAAPIIGTPYDEEILLGTSELRGSKLYRHIDTAKGLKAAGVWHVEAAVPGTYRFEIRRWPKEIASPMTDVPVSTKTVDSWVGTKPLKNLIYGNTFKALTIASVSLKTDGFFGQKKVSESMDSVVFEVGLPAGKHTVDAAFYDESGKELTKAYYIYVRKVL